MKQVSLALSVILAGLAITVVSCDSEKPFGSAAKTGSAATATAPAPASERALMSAVWSPGQADNDEGVEKIRGQADFSVLRRQSHVYPAETRAGHEDC